MKQLLVILFATFSLSGFAQNRCFGNVSSELPFAAGERLKFSVNYSSAMITTSVADIYFHVTQESFNNIPCYKISALGKTRPFFNLFFEMEDRYTTFIDTTNLRSIKSTSSLKEGGFQFKTDYTYNWRDGVVNTFGHNIKRDWRYYHTVQLTKCSYDALGLFFNMRRIDPKILVQNQQFNLDLVLDDTVRSISVKFLGREIKRIENLGRFNTLKFSCKFATTNDETFKDGAEFYIWISDDQNKIPIYLESPIRVGRIQAYLTSWEGLKHSFSSIIPK